MPSGGLPGTGFDPSKERGLEQRGGLEAETAELLRKGTPVTSESTEPGFSPSEKGAASAEK